MASHTYANLGDFETVKAKLVQSPRVDEHRDGSSVLRGWYVTFSKRLTDRQVNRAMTDIFNRQCSCSHDCCGHWQHGIYTHTINRIRPRTFFVLERAYRNI